ncbi:5-formyltetrahydrofolate cyclo-ligase [Pseudonocardia acaciae]|uniref:5-formyltetrahydrofolate cyclo-ligase n=1 Tax=Pseudonocardia acaciae TaxID=551276 RepID=UPI00048F3854|nr:5-formyltetrahydrofolate cyclo-ligase [Pseudonocardia acaciae]
MNTPRTKAEWRALLLARRRALPAELHATEARSLAAGVVASARAAHSVTMGGTSSPVCCYLPFGREPGSLAMLDALREAGRDVLLPVIPTDGADAPSTTAPLDWAPYQGPSSLVTGPYGLRQPAGPHWGPAAIAMADLVLIPALAVDRRGVRLGRGAGWYDRSLPLAHPGTPLVTVLRDAEVVDALPVERHDVLMTGVLTPHCGLRPLPLS